jgi:phospho-2-dehydro-3-deoxyheptonate aldolase
MIVRPEIHTDRTGQTDNERIKDITVLPPPEHLVRFFPISGTPVETLISDTRRNIRNIMTGKDDRLLVVIGPCYTTRPQPSTTHVSSRSSAPNSPTRWRL